jgi:hypothetical protein
MVPRQGRRWLRGFHAWPHAVDFAAGPERPNRSPRLPHGPGPVSVFLLLATKVGLILPTEI